MPAKRVAYVLKRYPRLSETFILNEILAHEAAGQELEIFSLRTPEDGPRHTDVERVRAPVTYLTEQPVGLREFGEALVGASTVLPESAQQLSYRGSTKHLWPLWQAWQVARAARDRGITHLHAHFATEATSIARMAAALIGISYSFTAHAKDIFHEDVDRERLEQFVRDASSVVTVSEYNVAYLRSEFGHHAERVRRIYNGLDLAEFPVATGPREEGLVLAVGRLVEKKGFDDLLRACDVLRRAGRSVRCLIVGDGDQRELLERLRVELGVADCTQLLGALPREEVRELVGRASVLAAPCVVGADGNRDGLPTVLLESMAMGTPCVSTPVTGIPEVVRDGETGLMVPERAPEQLARALARVLDDRQLREQIAGRARSLIERSFDLHDNAAQIRHLFDATPAPTGAV